MIVYSALHWSYYFYCAVGTIIVMETQQVQETQESIALKKRMKQREYSKRSYYKNEEYRKKKNKRDVENLKMKYNTDIVFRTNHKAYMVNRYWTEPEFREKSLARSKAWRDARK